MRMMRVIPWRSPNHALNQTAPTQDALAAPGQVIHGRTSHAAHADDDHIEFAHSGYAAAVRFRL